MRVLSTPQSWCRCGRTGIGLCSLVSNSPLKIFEMSLPTRETIVREVVFRKPAKEWMISSLTFVSSAFGD